MFPKIKKYVFKIVLWILFKFCEGIYTIFIITSWQVEEWQYKNGFKDRGEKKYSEEDFTIFSMLILNGTPLKLPEVKKFYISTPLSKDHIYKIIQHRKYANTHKPEYINFIRSEYLRKLYPQNYS